MEDSLVSWIILLIGVCCGAYSSFNFLIREYEDTKKRNNEYWDNLEWSDD